jgi:hypothetical protein
LVKYFAIRLISPQEAVLEHHDRIPAGDLRCQDKQFNRSSMLTTRDGQLADSERAGKVRVALADMNFAWSFRRVRRWAAGVWANRRF